MAKKLDVASLLRQIPSKLRIGADEYVVKKTTIPEHKNLWGELNTHEFTISIDIGPPNSQQLAKTVVHELLHGIWADRFLDLTHPEEEKVVDQLSAGLIAMLVDNPWILPWLLAALQK